MTMDTCEIVDAVEVFRRVEGIGDVGGGSWDEPGAPPEPEYIVDLLEMKVADGGAFWPLVDLILERGVVPDVYLVMWQGHLETSNGHHRLVAALMTGSKVKLHGPHCAGEIDCPLEPYQGWDILYGSDDQASGLLLEGLRESVVGE